MTSKRPIADTRVSEPLTSKCPPTATNVALQVVAAADVVAPAAPELPIDALQRLPALGASGGDPYWRLVSAFLVGYPAFR